LAAISGDRGWFRPFKSGHEGAEAATDRQQTGNISATDLQHIGKRNNVYIWRF